MINPKIFPFFYLYRLFNRLIPTCLILLHTALALHISVLSRRSTFCNNVYDHRHGTLNHFWMVGLILFTEIGHPVVKPKRLSVGLTDQRSRVLGRMETIRNREQHYAKDCPDGGRTENEFYSARQNDLLKRYAKVLQKYKRIEKIFSIYFKKTIQYIWWLYQPL